MASTSLNIVLERNKKLQALASSGSLPVDILARLADTTLLPYLSDLKNNVHRDGLDKKYSSKEAWFDVNSFYKKSLHRKVGKPDKNGNPGRETKATMYLEKGYEELREIQGLKTDKVYLEVAGDLKNSVIVTQVGNANVIGINNADQVGKYDGLVKKYGKFYKATPTQLKELNERTKNEIHQITLEAIK